VRVGMYFDVRRSFDTGYVDVCREVLDLVAWTDQVGIDHAWVGEHHFFDDGYAPQLLLLLAAAAARTARIRLGTAVLLALGRSRKTSRSGWVRRVRPAHVEPVASARACSPSTVGCCRPIGRGSRSPLNRVSHACSA
jgi:Luciferase-like monooxygenase